MKKKPPKNINWWYGYRTPSSMKSQERWDFAQKVGAKALIKTGWIFSVLGLLGFLWRSTEENYPFQLNVATILVLIGTFAMIFRVEYLIKKKFR